MAELREISTRYRIAIIEDHLLQRIRTEELLRSTGKYEIVFSGVSAPEFVEWTRSVRPEERAQLLVLDLMVERRPSAPVALVESMLQAGLRIVVLSALTSPVLVRRIVQAGVSSVVGKRDSEEDILAAIDAAIEDKEWMTTELASVIAGDPERPKLSIQEERALVLYASGLTVEQLGEEMNIGRETAKQYLDRVKKKYASQGVAIRSQLDYGRVAWVEGYLSPEFPRADVDPRT